VNKYTLLLGLLFFELILESGMQLSSLITKGLSFKNIILYLMLVLAVISRISSPINLSTPNTKKLKWVIILLVFYGGISLVIPYMGAVKGFNYSEAFIGLKNILLDGLVCYLVFYFFSLYKDKSFWLLRAMLIMIGIAALLTVIDAIYKINLFGFDEVDTNRSRGAFGEPNQTALIFALYAPLIASFAFGKRQFKVLYVLLAIFCVSAIITTSSRGGVLALAMGFLSFMLLIRNKISIGHKIFLLISLPLCGLIAWNILPEAYTEQLLNRLSFLGEKKINAQEASAGRTYLWQIGIKMWLESPVFGNGWTAFSSANNVAVHNTFLLYLIELGLIGAILFVYFWFKSIFFLRAVKNTIVYETDGIVLGGFISGIIALMTGLFFVNLYKPWLFVWAYIGVAHAYAAHFSKGH
jgi:O-antigen ligase